MGEYEQPVLGMKSCLDISECEGISKEWNARAWFVMKNAEVQLSEDDVLFPCAKIGVEAREQVKGTRGLEDAKITRSDHPLVKYAEKFTENFDLIAERKSAIYHLREVAKASIMAKYLIDTKVPLEDFWFNLADEDMAPCVMEVPQLWNERCYSQIQVKDGKIVDGERLAAPKVHGIYGGVEFGLEQFPVGVPAVPGRPAPAVRPVARPSAVRPRGLRVSSARVKQPQVLQFPTPAAIEAKGVDLNLGQFDLSEANEVTSQMQVGTWGDFIQPSGVVSTGAFWSSIKSDSESALAEEDKSLLKAVFNPSLSDRRNDGDVFIPPDATDSYVERLRKLVKQEDDVKQQRKELFFSNKFSMDRAGPLFPSSWTSKLEIAGGSLSGAAVLHPRPDYQAEAGVFDDVLKSASPTFEKSTEDGVHFRIYRVGSLEVRTTQENDSKENVGAVFSVCPPKDASAKGSQIRNVLQDDKLVKVTEYVEARGRYYVVVETEQGNVILTEKLRDGTVSWEENPADVMDRNSLAKVTWTLACRSAGVTVGDMRAYRAKEADSSRSSKCYAHGAFTLVARRVDLRSGSRQAAKSEGGWRQVKVSDWK